MMGSADRVRVLGSRHSFNRIADTTGTMVSRGRLPVDVTVDSDRQRARVEGAAAYGGVARRLHELGWGLHAIASLPHITVAGAVVSLGTLGAVTAVELDVEPTYDVAQTVYEGLGWDTVVAGLDAVTGLGTSVSVFTWWQDPDQAAAEALSRAWRRG